MWLPLLELKILFLGKLIDRKIMFQKKLEKKIKVFKTMSSTCLTIFFYMSSSKNDSAQTLIKFFQKHAFDFKRLPDEENFNSFNYLLQNANFFAQSNDALTPLEFEQVAGFLFSHVTVIALCYQNQI